MNLTITFCRVTVKSLTQELHAAFRRNDAGRIKRISALLLLTDHLSPSQVAERLGLGPSTLYGWLRAFLVDGIASLRPHKSTGRPAKLTSSQKQRLRELVTAGPEAAGYQTGCWSSALLQDLIHREFGQLYKEIITIQGIRRLHELQHWLALETLDTIAGITPPARHSTRGCASGGGDVPLLVSTASVAS